MNYIFLFTSQLDHCIISVIYCNKSSHLTSYLQFLMTHETLTLL